MSGLCLKLPGRRRSRSLWSPTAQKRTQNQPSRKYRDSNMPVGMEVTEDTPPDMLTGSMNLKLVLPTGKKIKTSVERSTPMMDLLVHITTCHKLSPSAHVLQPYGDRGVLPYKPSTPIGALDTVMIHVVPKNSLAQNQSNKMALKQISQPFEETYRIQVSLPRNQLYVLRANGRTTIGDIHNEICNEKNLDATKYSLRHPKELSKELREETTIAEYKCNQLVMVSNRANPVSQLSTDDIINAIQNINNNNIYQFEPSSRSLSPDSSVSPVEPAKPVRKKKPPAPKPPSIPIQKSKDKDKNEVISKDRVISHSRTSSDSSGYHEASLLSESPPSNNSSLPDSLPRRSKLDSKLKASSSHNVQVSQSLSKSMVDLKHDEQSTSQSSLKNAQSTTSLNTGRKKRAAPPPPQSIPPMRTLIEERNTDSSPETPDCKERSRTLEPERKVHPISDKSSTLPPGLNISEVESSSPVVNPPDERDLVMEDEEIDRIFNSATAEHSSLTAHSPINDFNNDSGRDSTNSNEGLILKKISEVLPNLPSPVKVSGSEELDFDFKVPAPPTFRDSPELSPKFADNKPPELIVTPDSPKKFECLPELSELSGSKSSDIAENSTKDLPKTPEMVKKSMPELELTPRSAVLSELSTVISQRTTSVTEIPIREEIIENSSSLDNFKITTYAPKNTSTVSIRRNNSLSRDIDEMRDSREAVVKRSVSHVSLFVRPSEAPRSRTLDRNQDRFAMRKTTSDYNIDSVGKRARPHSYIASQELQSVQVLRSILPQLSQSQGSLNTIIESETVTKSHQIDAATVESSVEQSISVRTVQQPESVRTVQQPESVRSSHQTESVRTVQQPESVRTVQQPESVRTVQQPESIRTVQQPDSVRTVQQPELVGTVRQTESIDQSDFQPKYQPRHEKEDKVAVSLGTWGERPKRQVSIKSDRDYVFGQTGVTLRKTNSEYSSMTDDMKSTTALSETKRHPSTLVNTALKQEHPRVLSFSSVIPKEKPESKSSISYQVKQESKVASALKKSDSFRESDLENKLTKPISIEAELDDKPKRLGVYKNLELETGNTKPLRQILNEVSRVPVVKSVELKQPYRITNHGLTRLKERFEADNTDNDKQDEAKETYESTDKIREKFETAIKKRNEITEKMLTRNVEHDKESKSKILEDKQSDDEYKRFSFTDVSNSAKANLSNRSLDFNRSKILLDDKSRLDRNENLSNQPTKINIQNDKVKMISETKIEYTQPSNRYTSVVGIGGDNDVVRVRVKTSTGRTIVPAQSQVNVDPRQQLLTSIRGFGGLESLKKVRS